MAVYDSRGLDKHRHNDNRRRFIERHKEAIKDAVDNQAMKRKIKDMGKKGGKVYVSPDEEPRLDFDEDLKDFIGTGNENFEKGDDFAVQNGKKGSGNGGTGDSDGGGEDEFQFSLSPEEFVEIYFSDMELPNLVKESLKETKKFKKHTGGYTKTGVPARLALKKTFENAIARKIANKNTKQPYLDEIDVRYRNVYLQPEPVTRAVMVCLMDVSGSMNFERKTMAKKFFYLLYMFLTKFYKNIDVRFIRYHNEAMAVDENDFFYSRETGGTDVKKALDYTYDYIKKEINYNDDNVYIAHVSDGDLGFGPEQRQVVDVYKNILHLVQYSTYLEVDGNGQGELTQMLRQLDSASDKFEMAIASAAKDIYNALRNLFSSK